MKVKDSWPILKKIDNSQLTTENKLKIHGSENEQFTVVQVNDSKSTEKYKANIHKNGSQKFTKVEIDNLRPRLVKI